MGTKLGMKRTLGVKAYPMKRTKIKPVSKKQAAENAELKKLTDKLRELCGNVSEYSGNPPDWKSNNKVEPHHVGTRYGKHLVNPFEILMVNRDDHDWLQAHMSYEMKQLLISQLIYPIRISQGFVESDYE